MTDTRALLREYVEDGSESAFRELVGQYVDLVYSTALRRMVGNAHGAEDVTQTVFTDLARKAATLPENLMLGGWLHRHCCFVCSNLRRAESRRAAREKEAVAMDLMHSESGSEAGWLEIAPELDEAIESLEQEDRDAIVLRFFERRNFRAIGEVIGGSENAAQKRVARALEKLKHLLSQRGVAISAGGLMAALSDRSVTAAPAALADEVSEKALSWTTANAGSGSVATAVGGISGAVLALWIITAVILGGGIVAAILLSKKKIFTAASVTESVASVSQTEKKGVPDTGRPAEPSTNATRAAAVPVAPESPIGLTLRLTVVAADSGAVIPNVAIAYRAIEGTRWVMKNLSASRSGICAVPYTTNTTELQLKTQEEGFADTRLRWELKRGNVIPEGYTLRLKRGKKIGGKIVDEQGELIPGATVGFNIDPDADLNLKIETHEFDWLQITAKDGTWATERVAESVLRRIHGSTSHPDYAESEYISFYNKGPAIQQMMAGNHVFHLRDSPIVKGIIVDANDKPIGGAKILVGELHNMSAREGRSDTNGHFALKGGESGTTLLTASAKGFAATTIKIAAKGGEEHRVVLRPGRNLKIRVVNKREEPVPRASVRLNTASLDVLESTNAPMPQAEFSARTDADGRVQWDAAPAEELTFDVRAPEYMYMSDRKVAADGVEHTLTLNDGLRIFGTVRDAATGAPIPRFQIIGGYASTYLPPGETEPNIHWSTTDRHWLPFSDGKFEHTWEEGIVVGVSENNFAFKFEAAGYRPFVTRVVKEAEGAVRFDVALQASGAGMITVLDATGQPAPETDVAFITRHRVLLLSGPTMQRNPNQLVRTTDARGQIAFEDEGIVRIVAVSRAGFALAKPADVAQDLKLRLAPWGRVEGCLLKRGKPETGLAVRLQSDVQTTGLFINTEEVMTDAGGNFAFQYAPTGKFGLTRRQKVSDLPSVYENLKFKDVEISPGQTMVVNTDDLSFEVRAQLTFPPNFEIGPNQRMHIKIISRMPGFDPGLITDQQAMRQYLARPEAQAALPEMRQWEMHEREPGIWSAANVPPGSWTLQAMVLEPVSKTASMVTSLLGYWDIEIPESSIEESFDLGNFILKPSSGKVP